MRFWEAVQQLRELPEYGWAIVRGDLIEADLDTWEKQTKCDLKHGYAFLDGELRFVAFDEIYVKGNHTRHEVVGCAYGPSFADLDAIDWLLSKSSRCP